MVTGDCVTLKALDAVNVEEMRAGKEINWFVPKCHETDCALILLSVEAFVLYFLPVVLILVSLSFCNAKLLQVSLYFVLTL